MPNKFIMTMAVSIFLALQGCDTGYNKLYDDSSSEDDDVDTPNCDQSPANTSLIPNGVTVYDLLASLTCNSNDDDGALMGQSAGSGDQLVNSTLNEYDRLIGALDTTTPAIVSIDYEHDRIYTDQQLLDANVKLEEHWDDGGIVAISWMPLNPWLNDATNPTGNPGSSADLAYSGAVDLEDLITSGTSANIIWRRKLDKVARALTELDLVNVPVLWRPLPAMNTSGNYWWGLDASYDSANATTRENAELYTALWEDMYTYLTVDKSLNNLIWVYSPAEGAELPDDTSLPDEVPVDWAYPGDDYVDVVAGIAENDQLTINDYEAINDLGKPFGMAQYNPLPAEEGGAFSPNKEANDNDSGGTFDNRVYADRLSGSYKNVGFWVTGHSYDYTEDNLNLRSNLALVDNPYAEELGKKSYILTLQKLNNNGMR